MGWLWTFQLILDIVLVAVLWRLLKERQSASDARGEPVEATLCREDFEQYQEALSDLCDRMQCEGEGWVNRLEQKTRVACQVIQRLEESTAGGQKRPVAVPSQPEEEVAVSAAAGSGRAATRDEVLYLRSQGYSVEQIARQLHLGQREVQLQLSLRQRTGQR